MTDEADAAVTVPFDGAGPDSAEPPPSRVPPDPCAADSDCTAGGVCATDKGVCVECVTDEPCARRRGRCEVLTNRCVGCLTASDCPNGWTCDDQTHECGLLCSSNVECQSPLFSICSSTRHVCVLCESDGDCGRFSFASGLSLRCRAGQCSECGMNEDCPTDRPYCESRIGFCEQCQVAAQCPEGNACVPLVPNTEFPRHCQPTG